MLISQSQVSAHVEDLWLEYRRPRYEFDILVYFFYIILKGISGFASLTVYLHSKLKFTIVNLVVFKQWIIFESDRFWFRSMNGIISFFDLILCSLVLFSKQSQANTLRIGCFIKIHFDKAKPLIICVYWLPINVDSRQIY